MCGDLEMLGNAEWTSLVMIGRSYSLVSAESFAAGPTGCVDWKMFMRGAAALAYLSLRHKKLGFDWTQKQIKKLTQGILLFDNNKKCTESPEDSWCF